MDSYYTGETPKIGDEVMDFWFSVYRVIGFREDIGALIIEPRRGGHPYWLPYVFMPTNTPKVPEWMRR